MDYMFLPFRRYADFSGRSRRMEFWMFFLFQMLVFGLFIVGLVIVGAAIGLTEELRNGSTALFDSGAGVGALVLLGIWSIWVLATIVPNAAVVVRRCHDQGISGWVGGILYGFYFLLFLISPIVAALPGIPLMILMFLDGNAGPNRYGQDPKGRGSDVFQ